MNVVSTIPKQLGDPLGGSGLDQRALVELALTRLRALAATTWTDHNTHDPGVTMLELLAYALTDLAHRASLELPDLLAVEADNAAHMRELFPSARTILPNRALTELDLRKLLIDLPGVKNAWLRPAEVSLWADTVHNTLSQTPTGVPGEVEVPLGGLFAVLLELIEDEPDSAAVIASARATLHANRNLGQDFTTIDIVATQQFSLCAELELAPEVEAATIGAEVLFRVALALAPQVPRWTLADALAQRHDDGRNYTVDELFAGPALEHGFILDEDLRAAELPSALRLSDVIHVIMDIPGVLAVREIVLVPAGAPPPRGDEIWLIPVTPGHKAELDPASSRLIYRKRGMAIAADQAQLDAQLDALWAGVREQDQAVDAEDHPIPLGRPFAVEDYYSVQNHFPAAYGIGELGLPAGVDARRRAQADQLHGYLLLFDQLMADFLAQLGNVASLYSLDPEQRDARFHQVVGSLREHLRIYGQADDPAVLTMLAGLDDPALQLARRERFLDHLLARYAEQLADYAAIVRSAFAEASDPFRSKCEFLRDYPELGAARGLGWNYGLQDAAQRWDTDNVSGLQRRLGRLLGIPNVNRRDLGTIDASEYADEGMFVIEHILLRPREADDPLLPICRDVNCQGCADTDPYSHRLHVLLPAYSLRFSNIEFRRFVERSIRAECPAHLLPKICWISRADMTSVAAAYRTWLLVDVGIDEGGIGRAQALRDLIEALLRARNVAEPASLRACESDEQAPKFVLGRSALGNPDNS